MSLSNIRQQQRFDNTIKFFSLFDKAKEQGIIMRRNNTRPKSLTTRIIYGAPFFNKVTEFRIFTSNKRCCFDSCFLFDIFLIPSQRNDNLVRRSEEPVENLESKSKKTGIELDPEANQQRKRLTIQGNTQSKAGPTETLMNFRDGKQRNCESSLHKLLIYYRHLFSFRHQPEPH